MLSGGSHGASGSPGDRTKCQVQVPGPGDRSACQVQGTGPGDRTGGQVQGTGPGARTRCQDQVPGPGDRSRGQDQVPGPGARSRGQVRVPGPTDSDTQASPIAFQPPCLHRQTAVSPTLHKCHANVDSVPQTIQFTSSNAGTTGRFVLQATRIWPPMLTAFAKERPNTVSRYMHGSS